MTARLRPLLALLLLLMPLLSQANNRVALVIGNANYQHTTVIPNARNDGEAMARRLEQLGFQVVAGTDLDYQGMRRQIRRFSDALESASVGLFFYAGHGLQVNGQNYLIPVDARLDDETDLDFNTIHMQAVMNLLDRSTDTSLVFLDACRDNPLTRSLARSMGRTRSGAIGQGLAQMQSSSAGMLVAFATQPGNVALDGEGQHSPFTEALLKHLESPGVEVRQLMGRVRQDVMASTENRQIPWEHSAMVGEFYFVPVNQTPQPQPPSNNPNLAGNPQAEQSFWDGVQSIGNPDAKRRGLQLYLERFPAGLYADLARLQLESVSASPPATAPQPTPTPVPRPEPPRHYSETQPALPTQRQRVQFPQGGVSVTYNEQLNPQQPRGYELRVMQGQQIITTAPGARIGVLDDQGRWLPAQRDSQGRHVAAIPRNDDYTVVVQGQGASQITIYIPPR